MNSPAIQEKYGSLDVKVYRDRDQMGKAAAGDIAAAIRTLLETQDTVRIIFAAAPSQNEVLAALKDASVDWTRVEAFHMDEYIGLAKDAPQGFANFLKDRLFDNVQFKSCLLMDFDPSGPEPGIREYARRISEAPIDIVCLGIGENGHIAFNDPANADFHDPEIVKIVRLDDVCRQQQVNDGCFAKFDDVPKTAVTLTIPALFSGKQLFCVVPTKFKRNAVKMMLTGPVSEECPASILREHPHCTLYLEPDSYFK